MRILPRIWKIPSLTLTRFLCQNPKYRKAQKKLCYHGIRGLEQTLRLLPSPRASSCWHILRISEIPLHVKNWEYALHQPNGPFSPEVILILSLTTTCWGRSICRPSRLGKGVRAWIFTLAPPKTMQNCQINLTLLSAANQSLGPFFSRSDSFIWITISWARLNMSVSLSEQARNQQRLFSVKKMIVCVEWFVQVFFRQLVDWCIEWIYHKIVKAHIQVFFMQHLLGPTQTIRQHVFCSQVVLYGQISSLTVVLRVLRSAWNQLGPETGDTRPMCWGGINDFMWDRATIEKVGLEDVAFSFSGVGQKSGFI